MSGSGHFAAHREDTLGAGGASSWPGKRGASHPLAVATISGGVVGGLLLMLAPAASFAHIVPWLIAGASAAVLVPRRTRARTPQRSHTVLLYAGTTLTGVYGGYFGAASGVLLLALLLAMTESVYLRA